MTHRAAHTLVTVCALTGCSPDAAPTTADGCDGGACGDAPVGDSASADGAARDTTGPDGANDSSIPPHDAGADADADTPKGDAADGGPSSVVPFTATGPWRARLPATTPIASNSAAVVANIAADITKFYGTFAINTDTFSAPIYTVAAGAPTQSWTFNDCQKTGYAPPAFLDCLKAIPSTPDMLVSMGTDQEISIYSPSLDEAWELWVANPGASPNACWGGCIEHVSANPGIFPPTLGATACGLPLLGFLVRIDELKAGLITHAVNVELPRTQAAVFSWPANRTDGNTADPDVLMEGQRMRLDPTFDVSTLPNAAERTIARAMQDYGVLLTDTAGAVVLQAEDPRSYMTAHGTTVNPYDALFEGRANYEVFKELPVDRLQVLPKDYGQSFMK